MTTRTLNLRPLGYSHTAMIEAAWDMEAGTLEGLGMEYVVAAAEQACQDGHVSFGPCGIITKADPLTTEEGFAVLLLACGIAVPDELEPYLTSISGARF